MTTVYHELLADCYLLILVPGGMGDSEKALDQALSRASRSGKPTVWVDCQRLGTLTAEAAALLSAYHQQLGRQGVRLMLSSVSEAARQELRRQAPSQRMRIVSMLPPAVALQPLPLAG